MKNLMAYVKPMLAEASPSGTTQSIVNTINTVVQYVQLVGAAVVILMFALAAFPFITGGQQGFELGKRKVIGIIVGAGLLFCATAVGTLVKTMYGYSG